MSNKGDTTTKKLVKEETKKWVKIAMKRAGKPYPKW